MPRRKSQSLNEGRIAELEDKLARAEVIDVSKLSGDTITFGATVTLIDEDTEKKAVWQIVGEPEADAKKRQDLHHLAARPRAGRQEERRAGRGRHAGRRPRPTRSSSWSGNSGGQMTDDRGTDKKVGRICHPSSVIRPPIP